MVFFYFFFIPAKYGTPAFTSNADDEHGNLEQHFQTAAIILGYDLDLFRKLSKSQTPLTVDELAATSGAEPALLGEYPSYLL